MHPQYLMILSLFLYADDVLLMSQSQIGLQKILDAFQ